MKSKLSALFDLTKDRLKTVEDAPFIVSIMGQTGVGTKLSANEITTLFNLGKQKAIKEAHHNNIITEAKTNTQQAFENIYYPLLMNAQATYDIEVRFGIQSHDVVLLD